MKKFICVGMLCACLLFTGCNKKAETKPATKQCDEEPQLMTTAGNHKVYSYCLDSFSYTIDGEKIDLRDYLANTDNSVENIIGTLEAKDTWDDGGSTLYRGNGISLVECFPLSFKKDGNIYISSAELTPYFCTE